MSLHEPPPHQEPATSQEFVSARARRRRAQRTLFTNDAEGRSAFLVALARRAYPSYELFVFAMVCGAVIGIGYLLDSQAILLFGALLAPLMTPWVGMSLSIVTGSARFFVQTFTALIISALLIFIGGALAGFASRPFLPLTLNEAFIHSRLWWQDLTVLALGAILLTVSFVRSEDRPYLPSTIIAYELFLPISAAGFGLGSGVVHLWPPGLFVFLIYLAWATFFGIITLFVLQFHPTTIGGFAFTGGIFLILATTLIFLTGFGSWTMQQAGLITPIPVTATIAIPSPRPIATITSSPKPQSSTAIVGNNTSAPTLTRTATFTAPKVTLPPTESSTPTVTTEPTAIVARIKAPEGGGAYIREKPGGKVLATLDNGSIVTIVAGDIQNVSGITWIHVTAIVNNINIDGWIIQTVLETATPIVNWEPSSTPAVTATP